MPFWCYTSRRLLPLFEFRDTKLLWCAISKHNGLKWGWRCNILMLLFIAGPANATMNVLCMWNKFCLNPNVVVCYEKLSGHEKVGFRLSFPLLKWLIILSAVVVAWIWVTKSWLSHHDVWQILLFSNRCMPKRFQSHVFLSLKFMRADRRTRTYTLFLSLSHTQTH